MLPYFVPKCCTVTVTDPDGRRHSLDVQATSTFDAAHLSGVVEAKKERAVGLPKPTLAAVFEVVADGKVYRVKGEALQKWIVERRQRWNGLKGLHVHQAARASVALDCPIRQYSQTGFPLTAKPKPVAVISARRVTFDVPPLSYAYLKH